MKDDIAQLIAYDSKWPEKAAVEMQIIRELIHRASFDIEHIGSTAIPGIHAKPIIDLMIGVPHLKDAESFIGPLESIGYSLWRDNPKKDRLYFVKGLRQFGGAGRTHHIHIVERASKLWQDHISFRDELRANPASAKIYQKLKTDLATKFGEDREAYTEGKSEFVQQILGISRSKNTLEIVFSPADPDLAEWWFNDRKESETQRFNPLAPSTVETLRERLSKASSDLSTFETSDSYFWVVRKGDQIVGHVTLQNINRMMLTAEIGYGISSAFRGQGLATLAIHKLAIDVFSKTPIRKLIAFVHEENTPSRKALEKVGFHLEGVLRKHYLVNGLPTNEAVYGLLRDDLLAERPDESR